MKCWKGELLYFIFLKFLILPDKTADQYPLAGYAVALPVLHIPLIFQRNTVIVDEKEAEVVRYIFSLAMQGKGSTGIAVQLQREGIPTVTLS